MGTRIDTKVSQVERFAFLHDAIVDGLYSEHDEQFCINYGKALVSVVKSNEPFDGINIAALCVELTRSEYMRLFRPEPPVVETPAIEWQVIEPEAAQPDLPLGTYTVVFDNDVYKTVDIEHVEEGNLAGKFIARFLSGPYNESDFQGFGFVDPETRRLHLWNRFQNIDRRWVDAVNVVLGADKDQRLGLAEAYAIRSGRCARCHRKLTVPASLNRGYGPDCAALMGIS